MTSTNNLGVALISVVPDMSNFASDMQRQLDRIDFTSMGREIGKDLSRGISGELGELNFQSVANDWMGLAADISSVGGLGVGTIGAMLASGKTLTGAFAALGKILLAIIAVLAVVAVAAGTAWIAWNLWGDEIKAHFARVREFLDPVVEVFRDSLGRAIEDVQPHLESLRNAPEGLSDMFKVIGTILGTILAPILAVLAGAFGFLVGVINGVISAFAGVVQFVTGIVEVISGFFSLIVGIFTGDGEKISEAWDMMWSGIENIVEGFKSAILGYIGGFIEGITSYFNELKAFAINTFNNIRDGISNAIAFAVSAVSGAVGRMAFAAGRMMRGLLDGIREGIINAVSKVRELAQKLVSTVGGFVGNMRSVATELINGLIQGIANGARRVADRMRELAREALNAAKNFLGINSPSREFAKIGVGICEGLVLGLNSGLSDVLKTVCDMADSITDTFEASAVASLDALYSGVGAPYSGSVGHSFTPVGAAGMGNTYMTFNTPVTGYHEVLAANRATQRMVARS